MTGLVARRRQGFWGGFLVFVLGFLLGAVATVAYLLYTGQASSLRIGRSSGLPVLAGMASAGMAPPGTTHPAATLYA